MQLKVHCIGQAPEAAGEALQQALAERGLPLLVQPQPADAASINRLLAQMLQDHDVLGALILPPYKSTALAYCQELTHAAQLLGTVNVMARRSSGLVYGDNTEVHGFTETLRATGVKHVRTALVLGAGQAARIALAGLRDLGCARYLVGFRNPRRPAELNSQLRGLRKQISFFPLREMEDFFRWAAESGLFEARPPLRTLGKKDDTIKRWELLVNATPVGLLESDPPLVDNLNFMLSFERVLDMVPRPEGTLLTRSAVAAGLPALTGEGLLDYSQGFAIDIWEREHKRRLLIASGQLDPFEEQQHNRQRWEAEARPPGRVPVLKRRRR